MVLLGGTFFQTIGGVLHHYFWSKQNKQEIISITHIWLGRTLITLGMINGGLGMRLGGDLTRSEYRAYGVIAGLIWVGWIGVVVAIPLKRGKEIPGTISYRKRELGSNAPFAVDETSGGQSREK